MFMRKLMLAFSTQLLNLGKEHLNMAKFYIPVSLLKILIYRSNKLMKMNPLFGPPYTCHQRAKLHGLGLCWPRVAIGA